MFKNLVVTQNYEKLRIKKTKEKRERPNTDGIYSSIFIPFSNEKLSPTEINDILIEIAWCIYAVSVSRQRHSMPEPFFNQSLKKPKGNVVSTLHNMFGFGVFSKQKGGDEKTQKKKVGGEGNKVGLSNGEKGKDEDIKLKHFKVFEPTANKTKIKTLIQEAKISSVNVKCSHSRNVKFNDQVQIFYRDADLVVELEGKLIDDSSEVKEDEKDEENEKDDVN
jgi:hypothetical protein